ncbi:MAG: hypothetical protein HQL87_11255 [Magnetococcales bacterium]|nr:hypothetical protein [Magnetococcales bacterium]
MAKTMDEIIFLPAKTTFQNSAIPFKNPGGSMPCGSTQDSISAATCLNAFYPATLCDLGKNPG